MMIIFLMVIGQAFLLVLTIDQLQVWLNTVIVNSKYYPGTQMILVKKMVVFEVILMVMADGMCWILLP